jgi:hypothetical protein
MNPFSGDYNGHEATVWCRENAKGDCSVLIESHPGKIKLYKWFWDKVRWRFTGPLVLRKREAK